MGRVANLAPLAAGCALALTLAWPKAVAVATTGVFNDPDDAMRAVEVRDFMAGQAWFDLVPHRLAPTHPFAMHWSRLVDLPLAAITRLFGTVLSPAEAELAMRLAVPSLLFVAALGAMLVIVRSLPGPRAAFPAALLTAGSAEIVSSFIPGHIHHHAEQVALLIGATAFTLRALAPSASWRPAASAGALAGLSLGIGLQNLPFVLGLAAIVGLSWIVDGRRASPALTGFGGGLALSAIAVFAADVPPSAWGEGACDAFSTAHLLGATLGGGLFLVLAASTSRLSAPGTRLAAALVAALATLAVLWRLYPACLHDPMAGVDPLLQRDWLAEVGEALPLRRLMDLDPSAGWTLALTLLAGLAATLGALVAAPAGTRPPWAGLLLLSLIGLFGSAYQVRVASSACLLVVPGLAWAVLAIHDRVAALPGRRPALLAAVLAGAVGNGALWPALALPLGRAPGATGPQGVSHGFAPQSCIAPASYDALRAQPPGLVLSTIDPGSTILATTAHSVLAAPYHRDTAGIRASLLAFAATPDAAENLVKGEGVTYVALCRASSEAAAAAARHPTGLAAALLAGHTPAWLEPLGTGTGPILLYRVRASGQVAGPGAAVVPQSASSAAP